MKNKCPRTTLSTPKSCDPPVSNPIPPQSNSPDDLLGTALANGENTVQFGRAESYNVVGAAE